MQCTEIINHASYPIDELDNPRRQAVIDAVREELAADGCALVKDFLSPAGLESLLAEAMERRDYAYFSEQKMTNAYLNDGDPSMPREHPVNYMMPRTNGFVTADHLGTGTHARELYDWAPLTRFIQDCLGKDDLYIYEDPISNMIINVGTPGTEFNWHFDTNEFTITMLLKPADSGGYFDYAPNIRNAKDECYDEVDAVLRGDRERVKRLDLQPGDLQLFLGRFSLHKVTENTGETDRLLLIMSFAEEPGMVGSKQRVKQLYGKTTEVHENQQARTDGLRD